jgi:citrate synthase
MSIEKLIGSEDKLVTKMGKAFLCERTVFRGKDLHHDLGSLDWFQLYFYSITGRILNEKESKLLNYYWVATSYPDPSIWPNHVASLAGSVRSTASLSLMSGLAISEASIYGRRPERRALDFFYRAGELQDQGIGLEDIAEAELKKNKTIYGYGRPLAKMDERVPHTLRLVEELGLNEGRYLKIALDLYKHLKEEKGLSMNIAAIDAALAADAGLSPEDYQLFMTPCFIAGIVPCYIDARDKPEGSFFPVRCESIVYEGKSKRSW